MPVSSSRPGWRRSPPPGTSLARRSRVVHAGTGAFSRLVSSGSSVAATVAPHAPLVRRAGIKGWRFPADKDRRRTPIGHPDAAHTQGPGGSGLGAAALALVAAALAVKAAGPVLGAVAEMVHVFLMVAGVAVGAGAAALVSWLSWRRRCPTLAGAAAPCPPLPAKMARPARRSRRSGERPSYPPRASMNHLAAFIPTSTACPPTTSPPSSPGRTGRRFGPDGYEPLGTFKTGQMVQSHGHLTRGGQRVTRGA
jgi:hypothetical protein